MHDIFYTFVEESHLEMKIIEKMSGLTLLVIGN